MTTSERKPFYDAQRDQLVDICNYLMDAPEALQELAPQPFWADDYVQRKRAVVDAVSSLTDLSAIALHRKLLEA
jgi:dGTPase